MQSFSVATYTRLLPGITNLTRRIRYYGFYCWLVEQFRSAPHHWNNLGFTNYIRRSELFFAYINRFREDLAGIPGAEYVGNNPLNDEQPNVDLAEGADYKTSKSYWKLRSGVFGQYYVGSMLSLGLIRKHDTIYSITEFGKELWKFLNERETFIRMETASRLKRPAVEGIAEELLLKFNEEINNLNDSDYLRVKQMIGHMVKQVMASNNYHVFMKNTRVISTNLFSKGTRYRKGAKK